MSFDFKFDVNQVLEQINQFVTAKGPVAYEAALNVKKYDALASLVGGGVIGGLFLISGSIMIAWSLSKLAMFDRIEERCQEIEKLIRELRDQEKVGSSRCYDSVWERLSIGRTEVDIPGSYGVYQGTGIICCVIGVLILLWSLGNAWNWIAVFHPDVALARDIFNTAVNRLAQ